MEAIAQRPLAAEQIALFRHDEFVADQLDHFVQMAPRGTDEVLVDIGGGCGFFARAVHQATGRAVRVIDVDAASVAAAQASGIDARCCNAFEPSTVGDETIASFNMILHHLVADTEAGTRALQIKALRVWLGRTRAIFVNEFIYESFVGRLSGRLIYEVTKSRALSAIGRVVGRAVPALFANTFGVGVRFRAHAEWVELFEEAGYRVLHRRIGRDERIALSRRLLLIRFLRRDSFLLVPLEP